MSLLLFSALTLLVGWYEGNSTCKKLTVGMLVVALWLELGGTNDSCSTVFRSVTKVGPGGPGTPTAQLSIIFMAYVVNMPIY